MSTSTPPNCNCSDAAACEELPPVLSASKLLVLNDANCQRTLVPRPGSLVYSDGVGVYYADGGGSAPIALPNLANYEQVPATTIPSLMTRLAGGVLAYLTPEVSTDGYVLTSLAGEWLLAPIPALLCFDPDDILTECCCPEAFAVWVLDESDPENPQMCLRSFNFCEDATNIEAGSIMSCEPETGCIRKLVGTSGDQVPAWDVATETWIPTEISDLIPTPESVLDVASVSWSYVNGALPVGALTFDHLLGIVSGWTITQSGAIASSAANAVPYAHNSMVITNTGWHEFHFTVRGAFASVGVATANPLPGQNFMTLQLLRNGSLVGPEIEVPVTASSAANDTEFDLNMRYSGALNWAMSCTAADRIDIDIQFKFSSIDTGGVTGTYEADFFLGTPGSGDSACTHTVEGTITRIT